MNSKKAQTMGLVLWVFIGVIVAIVLFQAAVDETAKTSMERTVSNTTYAIGVANTWTDLKGQELLNTPIVTNLTGTVIPTTNYTIEEGVSLTTGLKTIRYKALGAPTASASVNISYQYGDDGYVEDSGAVAIIGLIAIFAALAVAVIALVPTLRSGVLGMIGR